MSPNWVKPFSGTQLPLNFKFWNFIYKVLRNWVPDYFLGLCLLPPYIYPLPCPSHGSNTELFPFQVSAYTILSSYTTLPPSTSLIGLTHSQPWQLSVVVIARRILNHCAIQGLGARLAIAEGLSEFVPPSSKSPGVGLGRTQNMNTGIFGAPGMCLALHWVLCLHMHFDQSDPVRKAFSGRWRNLAKATYPAMLESGLKSGMSDCRTVSFPQPWALSQLESTFPVKGWVIPAQCLVGEGKTQDELFMTGALPHARCALGLPPAFLFWIWPTFSVPFFKKFTSWHGLSNQQTLKAASWPGPTELLEA